MNPRHKYLRTKRLWLTILYVGMAYGGLAVAAPASATQRTSRHARHHYHMGLVVPIGRSERDLKWSTIPNYQPPRSPGWHDDFGS